MTLLEKHGACLADLIRERREAKETLWQMRLDEKIMDMKQAIRDLSGTLTLTASSGSSTSIPSTSGGSESGSICTFSSTSEDAQNAQ